MKPTKATRNSCQAKEMPEVKARIHLEQVFTEEEWERVSLGVIPKDMDDRWFIYLEGEWLHFHRSWTGFCIFQVRLEAVGNSFKVIEAWVNRDPQQYGRTDDNYDAALLSFLIQRALLGREVPYPPHPEYARIRKSRRKWWQLWK